MSSPYAILGLHPDADPRAAKAAFHAVAKTCHPDVNADPRARQRFEDAREAYRVITAGAASADFVPNVSPRAGRMTEIDLAVSVWTAARGGAVKGSCPLGKASVRVPAGARTGDRIITRIGKTDVACVIRVDRGTRWCCQRLLPTWKSQCACASGGANWRPYYHPHRQN